MGRAITDGLIAATFDPDSESVAFSSDGSLLSVGLDDGGVHLHRLDNRLAKLVHSLEPHETPIDSLAFSPDGKQLVSAGTDGEIRVWNVEGGELTSKIATGTERVPDMLVLPDGDTLVTTNGQGDLHLFSIGDSRRIKEINKPQGTNGQLLAHSLALTRDGKTLVTGGGRDVSLWQVRGWKHRKRIEQPSSIHSIAITPDGSRILAVGEENLVIWDLSSGKNLRTEGSWDFPTGATDTVAASPDGKTLAAVNYNNRVYVYSADDGARQTNFAAMGKQAVQESTVLEFSSDGKVLAVGIGADISLRDPATGEEVGRLPDVEPQFITALVFSPDGSRLAAGGRHKTVTVWDVSAFSIPPEGLAAVDKSTQPPDDDKPALPSDSVDKGFRTWTSANGKFTVEARMTKVIGQTVSLQKRDGKEIQVPIDMLSKADRDFITKKRQ